MLLSRDDTRALLRCPVTHSPLRLSEDGSSLTPEADKDAAYAVVSGLPILIDFASSIFDQSDINTSNAESVVARRAYSGLLGVFKRLVSPNKRTTSRNASELLTLLQPTPEDPKRVLVVGGGSVGQSMDAIYRCDGLEIVAFDVYGSDHVQFVADAHQIPLAEATFDCVIIQAVLEHVLDPNRVVSEIHRVLRPGGYVYAEPPFMQHVHEGPYDFTRFTDSGHRYLFRDFALVGSGSSGGAGTQLLWSLDYFFRSVFRSRRAGKVAKLLMFWVRFFDRVIPADYSVDAASGTFFLGRKTSGFQMAPKDAAAYYKGAQ